MKTLRDNRKKRSVGGKIIASCKNWHAQPQLTPLTDLIIYICIPPNKYASLVLLFFSTIYLSFKRIQAS